jgi:hypothetical protein
MWSADGMCRLPQADIRPTERCLRSSAQPELRLILGAQITLSARILMKTQKVQRGKLTESRL